MDTVTGRSIRGQHGANILWPTPHEEALTRLKKSGLSYREVALALNAQFNTNYSRSATVGKANRMGLYEAAPKSSPEAIAARKKARDERRNSQQRARRAVERIRVIQPSRVETEMRCAAIEPLHVALTDLEQHHCRWPFGDGPFTFCGHDKFAGSYCAAHFFLGIGGGTSSERAANRVSRSLEGAR